MTSSWLHLLKGWSLLKIRGDSIDSYGQEVMVKIIRDVLLMDWPREFKKHILLKELLWKTDAPRGVRGDNSNIIFSAEAKTLWEDNEAHGKKGRGKRAGLLFEHAVPRSAICTILLDKKKPTLKFISGTLNRMIVRVAVTKEEDRKLNEAGLRQQMPDDWDGEDILARHKKAKIKHVKWLPEEYKRPVVKSAVS